MVSKISRRSCMAMTLMISILRRADKPLRSKSYGCLLPALQWAQILCCYGARDWRFVQPKLTDT